MGIRHIELLFPYDVQEPPPQAPDLSSNGLITELIIEPI